MAATSLEERICVVETELERLRKQLAEVKPQTTARWERVFGTFADSEGFEEAVQLGRKYRESLRPAVVEEVD
jgi:hypothetical protein